MCASLDSLSRFWSLSFSSCVFLLKFSSSSSLGKEPLLQDKIHAMVYPMPEYFSDPHAVHVVAVAPLQDQVADLQNFTTTAASGEFQVFFFFPLCTRASTFKQVLF